MISLEQCNQQQPCSNCIKTGTKCVFDQEQDGRRRAARKRNVEELELKRDALDTILEALRTADDKNTQHLLNLIKSNVPLDEIIQYASDIGQDLSKGRLTNLTAAIDTRLSRKKVLSIDYLCDTPPYRVPAAPWTTVTEDDDLVSHLVSTYCTWYHPAYPCLIRDLFINDMDSGNLDSKYCSPALVNAMLALACVDMTTISPNTSTD